MLQQDISDGQGSQDLKRCFLMHSFYLIPSFSLKPSIQKIKILSSGSITSWQIEGKRMETVIDFFLEGSKITEDGDCSHEIKRCLLLGKKKQNKTKL